MTRIKDALRPHLESLPSDPASFASRLNPTPSDSNRASTRIGSINSWTSRKLKKPPVGLHFGGARIAWLGGRDEGVFGVAVLALFSMSASADLAEELAASGRSDEDKARDAARRPAEVLAFLGVEPGMTVMDLLASGGWYTEVLSVAVGSEGTVYAQNPPMLLGRNDGAYDKAITARLAGSRLPNVIRLDHEVNNTGIGARHAGRGPDRAQPA